MNKKNNNNDFPLLTVIIPVYNVEEYLHRCIDSIIGQTYKNLEIILVNDGSNDSSGEICNWYQDKHDNVVVFHQENCGQSAARNTGLTLATGSLISFIDSDDWIESDMYSSMVSIMMDHDLDIVECDIIPSNEDRPDSNSDWNLILENQSECLIRVIEKEKFSVCRRIYNRDLLQGLTFIPNKLYEDLFYSIQVLQRIDKIGYIQFPFYTYFRDRSDSTMRSEYNLKKLNSIDAGLFVYEETKDYSPDVRQKAINFWIKFLGQHYNSLFEFPELDKELEHRRKIKKTIKEFYNKADRSIQAYLIKSLPIWLYNWFIKLNLYRLKLQSALRKT